MRKASFLIIILCSVFAPWSQLWADAGQSSFQQRCAACHTVGGGDRVGPDLAGVTQRRDPKWLLRWIMEPDKMLAEKDPTAMEIFKKFNQIPMPNLAVTEAEAQILIEYLAGTAVESAAPGTQPTQDVSLTQNAFFDGLTGVQLIALVVFLILSAVIVFIFWQIVRTTAKPVPTIDMKSAYKLRKKFFLGSTVLILGTLAATLPRTPYPDQLLTPDRLVYATARQFSFVFSSEPITSPSDNDQSKIVNALELPVDALVEFRVTSLDVNHGFAIYDSNRAIIAQTQAMPGYVNRLRVRFPKPGVYHILCLEYCGLAHHLMRTSLTVR